VDLTLESAGRTCVEGQTITIVNLMQMGMDLRYSPVKGNHHAAEAMSIQDIGVIDLKRPSSILHNSVDCFS
jgi:hypothetical protein